MLIPRYNCFKVDLPTGILPNWLNDLYMDILQDANLLKVYPNGPRDCLSESLTGFDIPGLHLVLNEQTVPDSTHTTNITRYWPRGLNNVRILDDNELSLTFRHIDGFHSFHMLRNAIEYMADDFAQKSQGELYKTIGQIMVTTNLTDNYQIVDVYQDVVYSNIDGNEFKFNAMASENTFTVRCKFSDYNSDIYYKGKIVRSTKYNHNIGN